MKIDYLSKTTLKLTLTAEDMNDYELDYTELSARSLKSRRRLCVLLKELSDEGSLFGNDELFLDDKRFFVEAFPRLDGGCLLYVSTLPDKDGRQSGFISELKSAAAFICEIEDSELLRRLCVELESEKERNRIEFSSALYSDGKRWRIALRPHNACAKQLEAALSRFGKLIKGELNAAYTAEHFRTVIPENASMKISRCP